MAGRVDGRAAECKGRAFRGFVSGSRYDCGAGWLGFNRRFYAACAMAVPLRKGCRVLDLGCGTGSLMLAMAGRTAPGSLLAGVDLSADQLSYARVKLARAAVPFDLCLASIDELPFEDGSFDLVVSSLTFHAVPSPVRRGAIAEARRVLRPGGCFALIDHARPLPGLVGLLWVVPMLLHCDRENWSNVYPDLCREAGFALLTDVYINPLVRCQVFVRP